MINWACGKKCYNNYEEGYKKGDYMEKLEKKKRGSKYRELFCEKNYMLETLASIISRFGDGIDTIALCIVPITASIVGVISKFINVKTLFSGFGIACIILFLLLIFSKTLKRFDEA